MTTDRASTYRQWDGDIAKALLHEAREGAAPLGAEAANGAKRFTDGAGRKGVFE